MERKLKILRDVIEVLTIFLNKPILQNRKQIRLTIVQLCMLYKIMLKKKCFRSVWVKPIYSIQQRLLQGDSENLIELLKTTDHSLYFNYLRMSVDCFEKLYAIVEPSITKQFVVREPIPARTRLQICIRYLASGDSMRSIAYAFRVSPNTVSDIINQVSTAIWQKLKDKVLKIPSEQEWKEIAHDFGELWNYPHCIGAIDGKHIVIEAPPHSGSFYYNYKKAHSFNLTAVSDARYRFILVDVGKEGRRSDAGVFSMSEIKSRLESKTLNLPEPSMVGKYQLPYVLIADEAYPLTEYLMRPYPKSCNLNLNKKVYNYRHSRARRIIESAFGLLVSRWRIYRRPINCYVSKAECMVLCTICLHNFIINEELQKSSRDRRYCNRYEAESQTASEGMINIEKTVNNSIGKKSGRYYRDTFTEYFINEGAVEWQWEKAANNEF